MKKNRLTRANIDELAKIMPVLNETEQRGVIGGGEHVYTMSEYESMAYYGEWKGGWIQGENGEPFYMMEEVVITGKKEENDNSGYGFNTSINNNGNYTSFNDWVTFLQNKSDWPGGWVDVSGEGQLTYVMQEIVIAAVKDAVHFDSMKAFADYYNISTGSSILRGIVAEVTSKLFGTSFFSSVDSDARHNCFINFTGSVSNDNGMWVKFDSDKNTIKAYDNSGNLIYETK